MHKLLHDAAKAAERAHVDPGAPTTPSSFLSKQAQSSPSTRISTVQTMHVCRRCALTRRCRLLDLGLLRRPLAMRTGCVAPCSTAPMVTVHQQALH